MDIDLIRFHPGKHSTLGMLVDSQSREFLGFTCEDEHRDIKVPGQTRIPAGSYDIGLRASGGMNSRYQQRFSFHVGMLWLQDVPGFEWIYIHTGNTHEHTEGCILVGWNGNAFEQGGGTVQRSVDCYEKLYKSMALAADRGDCRIHIYDQLWSMT